MRIGLLSPVTLTLMIPAIPKRRLRALDRKLRLAAHSTGAYIFATSASHLAMLPGTLAQESKEASVMEGTALPPGSTPLL